MRTASSMSAPPIPIRALVRKRHSRSSARPRKKKAPRSEAKRAPRAERRPVSTRADVLLWAQRVVAMRTSPAHTILEIKADASIEDAQAAFYKIARIAHPDLHRNG